MLEIKLRHQRRGEHVHTDVFARWTEGGETFAKLGRLVTDVGQYQLIWAALGLGADRMDGHLHIVSQGDTQVVNA